MALALLAIAPVAGLGEASAQGAHHVEAPPPLEAHAPVPYVEVRASAVAPLVREGVCPSGPDCVMGGGVGFGAGLEIRSADRVGFIAGYDFWLVDGGSVFEIGMVHTLRAGLRYIIDDTTRVHPFIEGSGVALLFGDTASVATGGGGVELGGGAELELTESVAVITGLGLWLFATAPFQTRDGARRADDFTLDLVLQLSVGVVITGGPLPDT